MQTDRSHQSIITVVPAMSTITPVPFNEKATCPGTNKQCVFIKLVSITALTIVYSHAKLKLKYKSNRKFQSFINVHVNEVLRSLFDQEENSARPLKKCQVKLHHLVWLVKPRRDLTEIMNVLARFASEKQKVVSAFILSDSLLPLY